jgi:hypothetical protein
MKKLLIFLIFFLASGICSQADAGPFFRKTKHKPVYRQSRQAIRRAANDKPFYTRLNGKVVRNTRTVEMQKRRCQSSKKLTRELNRK